MCVDKGGRSMARNSLTNIAYENLKNKTEVVAFNILWKEVCSEIGFTEDMAKRKIASFYNALMLDSRFISLEKNNWDLRERYAEDTLKIDPELADDYDDYDQEAYAEDYDFPIEIDID